MSEEETTPRETPVPSETAAAGGPAPSDGDEGGETEPLETTDAALRAMTAERDKLRDQLLRTAADFDNYRKRARRDVDDAKTRSRDDVLREVLDVADNLERAAQAAEGAANVQAVADGVRLVLRSFQDMTARLGLERVSTVGQRFDPSLHDAVQQVESAEHEPGVIVAEVQAGYRLAGKLVRPSLVVVAKAVSN